MYCLRIRPTSFVNPNDPESGALFATTKVWIDDPANDVEYVGMDGKIRKKQSVNYTLEPHAVVGLEDEELGKSIFKKLTPILEEVTGAEPDYIIKWDPAKPRPSSKPETDEEIVKQVTDLLKNTPEDEIAFTKSDGPQVKWIEKQLGYDIDSAHRDLAWEEFQKNV